MTIMPENWNNCTTDWDLEYVAASLGFDLIRDGLHVSNRSNKSPIPLVDYRVASKPGYWRHLENMSGFIGERKDIVAFLFGFHVRNEMAHEDDKKMLEIVSKHLFPYGPPKTESP